jgi:hypothetical protein
MDGRRQRPPDQRDRRADGAADRLADPDVLRLIHHCRAAAGLAERPSGLPDERRA